MIVVMGVVMIVVMGVIVIVVMGVIVVMIVIMQLIMEILIVLHHRRQRFTADGLLLDIGQAGNVVDHLLLEQRAADLDDRPGILLVEFVDLAFLAGELAGAGDQRLLHLLVADDDAVLLAERAEHEAEADAAFGDGAVFLAGFFFGGAFVLEALSLRFISVRERTRCR